MPRGTTCRSQKMPHVAFEAVVQPPYIMDEETGPHKLICFSPILPLPLPPPNLRDQKHKNGRYQVAQRAHSGFSIRCYGTPPCSFMYYDFFHATVVEFNSCNNDHTVQKAKEYLRSSLHGNVCLPLL